MTQHDITSIAYRDRIHEERCGSCGYPFDVDSFRDGGRVYFCGDCSAFYCSNHCHRKDAKVRQIIEMEEEPK